MANELRKFVDDFLTALIPKKLVLGTRVNKVSLGQYETSTGVKVDIYRIDYYTGNTGQAKDGTFQYSRYAGNIGGVSFSSETYQQLQKILTTIG